MLFGAWSLLAGPYVWLRFLSHAAGQAPREVALVMGSVSLILGAILALRRESGRQVQAADSISRIGLIWIALGLDSSLGLAAGLFLLLDLLLSKLLFHVAMSNGREVDAPLRQALYLLGAWGTAGLPPSIGFFGRWLLLVALFDAGRPAYAPVVLLAVPLTLAYLWRGWTLLPSGRAGPFRLAVLGPRVLAGILALVPLLGLAASWLWSRSLGPAVEAVLRGPVMEPRWMIGSALGWALPWTVLLLLLLGLGTWWLGAWRRRPVEGLAPSPASPAAGPLQEPLPVLVRESYWLSWISRPARVYQALSQSAVWTAKLFQSGVNFLERHTTYFLLVVLLAAAAVMVVLAR
jgi:formate hydrogenlyase subunit 3/multisubunit Na+/H+ antiporter MnhD subunit